MIDEDGAAQGWCQYGSPEELSNIKHRREYDKDAPARPDWRVTCVCVDRKHRGQGIARAALEGALDQIALRGGGLVEAISETTAGREAQGRFLFSATVELLEQYGFTRGRQVGKHAWIMSRSVDPFEHLGTSASGEARRTAETSRGGGVGRSPLRHGTLRSES